MNNLGNDLHLNRDHFKTIHQSEFHTHRTMETARSKSKRGTDKCEDDFEKLFYKTISIDNTNSLSVGLRNPKTTRVSNVHEKFSTSTRSKHGNSRASS